MSKHFQIIFSIILLFHAKSFAQISEEYNKLNDAKRYIIKQSQIYKCGTYYLGIYPKVKERYMSILPDEDTINSLDKSNYVEKFSDKLGTIRYTWANNHSGFSFEFVIKIDIKNESATHDLYIKQKSGLIDRVSCEYKKNYGEEFIR